VELHNIMDTPTLDNHQKESILSALRQLKDPGNDLMESTARIIGERTGVDYVCITKCDRPDGQLVRSLALWSAEGIFEGLEYCLEGTPCKVVSENGSLRMPIDIQKEFPDDELLVELKLEGYFGLAMYDSKQRVIGIVSLLSCSPLHISDEAQFEIELLTSIASSELERSLLATPYSARLAELIATTKFSVFDSVIVDLAHEFNQPLTVIENLSYLIRTRLGSGEAHEESNKLLDEISVQIGRVGEKLRQYRQLSSRNKASKELVDLEKLVKQVAQVFESECWHKDIDFWFNKSNEDFNFRVNPSYVEIVLYYLIRRALDLIHSDPVKHPMLELRIEKSGSYVRVILSLNMKAGAIGDFFPGGSASDQSLGEFDLGNNVYADIIRNIGGRISFDADEVLGRSNIVLNLPCSAKSLPDHR